MIRLIFALILCFVLGCGPDAPPPPKKGSSTSGFPSLSDMLVVEIVHWEAVMCAFRSRSEVCREDSHWKVALNRRESPDWPAAIAFIQSEAKRLANPKKPGVSTIRAEIAAESGAPFGEIQKARAACGAAGIVDLTFTEFQGTLVNLKPSPIGVVSGEEVVLLIGKQGSSENARWVAREELLEAIGAAMPGRRLSIVIKPLDSTVWGEVLRLRDDCRKAGYADVEFAARK